MGSLATRFKHVRQGVVVLRHIVLPAQGTEVRNDETTLRLYLDDLALVLISPSLVFTLPDDCSAWPPVGFHLGSEHIPLDLSRISQGRPHPRGHSGDVDLCGRNDPGHGSCSLPADALARAGYPTSAGLCRTACEMGGAARASRTRIISLGIGQTIAHDAIDQ